MFITSTEQFTSAAKSHAESQIAMFNAFTDAMFSNIEKTVELSLHTFKSVLEDSYSNTQQLIAAKNPQEFMSLAASHTKPRTDKVVAYGQQLSNIAANGQAELSKLTEKQVTESTSKASALVQEVTKNAPAGLENVSKLMQSLIGNVSAGYEQFSKNAKQGADALQTNLNLASSQFIHEQEKALNPNQPHQPH